MPTFRVHRLLASSCYQFISILVLPGKFQETGCGGPKYLMRNSTFPAICVVEISGAVRQALSDFDVLHASSTILIRELSRTKMLVSVSRSSRVTDPAANFGGGGNISPCLKVSYFFISLSLVFSLILFDLIFVSCFS